MMRIVIMIMVMIKDWWNFVLKYIIVTLAAMKIMIMTTINNSNKGNDDDIIKKENLIYIKHISFWQHIPRRKNNSCLDAIHQQILRLKALTSLRRETRRFLTRLKELADGKNAKHPLGNITMLLTKEDKDEYVEEAL